VQSNEIFAIFVREGIRGVVSSFSLDARARLFMLLALEAVPAGEAFLLSLHLLFKLCSLSLTLTRCASVVAMGAIDGIVLGS
jgi:hypothetical protein